MRRASLHIAGAFLVAFAAAACHPPTTNEVKVERPWSPATPAGASVGAAYLRIVASSGDTLLSASTPIADRIEMHTSVEENGMMRMRPLPSVALAAGEPFVFAPGGAHFMLLELHGPLVAGTKFPLTLLLQKSGALTIEVQVTELGARAP